MWQWVLNILLQTLTTFGVIGYTEPIFLAALFPALFLCKPQ